MPEIKYSAFLQLVINTLENAEPEEYFICLHLSWDSELQKYPEHRKTLKAAIKRKTKSLYRKYEPSWCGTTLLHLRQEYSGDFDAKQLRIIWLKSLISYHSSRGN